MGNVSLGIAAAIGPDIAAALAPRLEQAGFRALWVNDTPGADALEVAAAAARETETLRVATGVIPLDRRPAASILDDIARLEIPADRLTIGVGSGQTRAGGLDLVRSSLHDLRAGTDAELAVGALGPKMRTLAGTHSDAVLLSWLTPEAAAEQARELHDLAPKGRAVLYARANAHPDARERLEKEADQYAGYPAYAGHFARLGFGARDTVLPVEGGDIASGIANYTAAVDELVLRAITPNDALEEYLEFLPLAK